MKRECPQCGFELRSMSSYEKFVHEKLERFSTKGAYGSSLVGFDVWVDAKVGGTFHIPDLGVEVTLVESQTNYDYEYAENAVYLVLRLGEDDYYIKHGSRDSYGNTDWEDGEFRNVVRQTREAWVWVENA